ncbi:MAG: hypothetical protein M1840_003284 [Geoglossum simile]|nr:MAG: hypothetical protein M1840_003284 [Geoglossum simile]
MLVDKYVEYAHGNRLGDRRIVLDSTLLLDILAAGNMRVVPPSLLLERSLATIRSECRIAKDLDQPVLILIFGHGDQYTGGVSIGGQKTSDAPRLTIASMKQAIGKGIDVSILMTSCYSGCWIVNPQLTVSAMTAAGPENMSESWAQSQSSSRTTGSIYASAVLQALIKMEEPTMTQEHGSTTCVDRDDLISSSTYAELSRVICRTLLDDVDTMGEDHGIKFSAQNDVWETEWRQRSGIPLGPYKERWEMLRSVPVDTADPCTNRCPRAQCDEASPSQASAKFSYGLRGSSSVRGLRGVVQSMAENYMLSFPGRDSFAPNVYHYTFRNMVLGKVVVDDDQLVDLFDILHYRLSGMRLASEYASILSLPLPDCFAHNTDAWIQDISLAGRQHDPAGQAAREKRNHYKAIHSLVYDAQIFDAALRDQGWDYSKPCDYLAVGLAESGMTLEQAEIAVKKLQACKWIFKFYFTQIPYLTPS